MKIEKYMLETAKALLKEKNVAFWEYEDSVVISNDGCFAMFVPREKFIFNAEPKGTFAGMIPRDWQCHEMRYTDTFEQLGKKTVQSVRTRFRKVENTDRRKIFEVFRYGHKY